jgi:2-succinyl-5-enolpyruvyl-6-hydroxy-3-cyclohexene-1-carboxylate synthase
VIADPLSGLRSVGDPDDGLLVHYDAWLASPTVASLVPDWVIQFGATPTSKRLTQWLASHPETDRTVVGDSGRLPDAAHTARRLVAAGAEALAEALMARLVQPPQADEAWTAQLTKADAAAAAVLAKDAPWEGTVPSDAATGLTAHDALFVSGSLPVRDLDRYGGVLPQGLRVLANRGASGIDGVVSTAAGAAVALDGRVRAVVGDVALHHDLNGVAAFARLAPHGTLIVVNNGGGAIFDQLPIAEADVAFDELFRTPPGLDLERVADLFGMPFARVAEGADVAGAVARAGSGLVEVVVDARGSRERRRSLDASVARAVDGTLSGTARSGTPA